jgi:hypothetical protein
MHFIRFVLPVAALSATAAARAIPDDYSNFPKMNPKPDSGVYPPGHKYPTNVQLGAPYPLETGGAPPPNHKQPKKHKHHKKPDCHQKPHNPTPTGHIYNLLPKREQSQPMYPAPTGGATYEHPKKPNNPVVNHDKPAPASFPTLCPNKDEGVYPMYIDPDTGAYQTGDLNKLAGNTGGVFLAAPTGHLDNVYHPTGVMFAVGTGTLPAPTPADGHK